MTGIKDLKPDVIVGDSHFSCSGVINDLLDSKLVLICPSGLTHAMLPVFKNPNPLSYAPQPFTALDDRMDFWGRLTNVAGFLLANVIGRVFMFPAVDKVKHRYDIKPDVNTEEALAKAELYLVQAHFALDIPRPLTPCKSLIEIPPVRDPWPRVATYQNSSVPYVDFTCLLAFHKAFGSICPSDGCQSG